MTSNARHTPHWFYLVVTLFLLSGCATTPAPTEKSRESVTVAPSTLSPAETKTYQDALKRIEQGEPDKAISSLNRLAQAHPGQAGLWINLAIANYRDSKPKEATAALLRARAINDNIAAINNLAGLIAVDEGDYSSAEKQYQAALKLNSNFAEAHYNLALLYDIFYQDIARAVEHYQRYLSLTPTEDKHTAAWVEELKSTLKRRGES